MRWSSWRYGSGITSPICWKRGPLHHPKSRPGVVDLHTARHPQTSSAGTRGNVWSIAAGTSLLLSLDAGREWRQIGLPKDNPGTFTRVLAHRRGWGDLHRRP